jgi:vacuolar-type H+-ATPase subunit E/Vma4
MQEITTITGFNEKPDNIEPVNEQLLEQIKNISNNEMYERIDKALMELIGRTMTFSQVVSFVKHKDSVAYDFVIGRSQRIMAPLNVLP